MSQHRDLATFIYLLRACAVEGSRLLEHSSSLHTGVIESQGSKLVTGLVTDLRQRSSDLRDSLPWVDDERGDDSLTERLRRQYAPLPASSGEKADLEALINSNKWQVLGEFEGVRVSKQMIPGSEHACLKAEAVLNAPADTVLHCYATSEQDLIKTYNPQFKEGRDLEPPNRALEKISWCMSHSVGPVASREFITRVRYLHLPDGSVVCLSTGLDSHPKSPARPGVIRGRIITAVQHVTPLPGARCRFVSVCHCDPGGSIPTFVTNLLAKRDAPRYLLRLEQAALQLAQRQAGRSFDDSIASAAWGRDVRLAVR